MFILLRKSTQFIPKSNHEGAFFEKIAAIFGQKHYLCPRIAIVLHDKLKIIYYTTNRIIKQ